MATRATNRSDRVGQPRQANHLGRRHFDPLITVATVKRITFHGLRHTCATLLLQAGEPVHVVSKRLGHARAGDHVEHLRGRAAGYAETAVATIGACCTGKVG